jgi:hypothetical protein
MSCGLDSYPTEQQVVSAAKSLASALLAVLRSDPDMRALLLYMRTPKQTSQVDLILEQSTKERFTKT